jgi:hypothetical protein
MRSLLCGRHGTVPARVRLVLVSFRPAPARCRYMTARLAGRRKRVGLLTIAQIDLGTCCCCRPRARARYASAVRAVRAIVSCATRRLVRAKLLRMMLRFCAFLAAMTTASATSAANVTCCVGWPAKLGKHPSVPEQKQACEAAGNARHDGGQYKFNLHRGTPQAVCGAKLGCDCCRTGPEIPGLCAHGAGPHHKPSGPPPPPPTPTPGDPAAVTVFSAMLANTSCYRIPSIVQTKTGALVAFAEAREGSCGDGAVHSIAVRSSVDNGTTWCDAKPTIFFLIHAQGNHLKAMHSQG